MELGYAPPERFRDAVDQAHDVVIRELKIDDFGANDYLAGLKVVLQSMDYDPQFTEYGRRIAWGRVIEVLRGRASAIRSMKDNPAYSAVVIGSPVIITGIPRTGTTALHRLMALDDRFQGLQSWLLDFPMPRPPIELWPEYPQFRKSVAGIDAHYAALPHTRVAHDRAAEEVHECCMMLRQSFVSNLWTSGHSAATYDAWWQCQSELASYHHYYRCVQLIGLNDQDKRWLLKNPGHLDNLDLLFAVFPDARVIQTHRDPAKAMPSVVSLLMGMHKIMEHGREQQRGENMLARDSAKWANAVNKAHRVRQSHPDQILDVVHGELHAEPMRTLERIYAFIGADISDELRIAFTRRIAAKPELSHGEHRYNIADYGMTAEEVRDAFGDYVDRHDLLENKRFCN